MSKYTTELRFICETEAGLTDSEGYDSINTVLNESYDKVFDFEYPIFDPLYKPVLEKKILKHYYTREIGFETYGRWKLALDARMNEIMPYYNKLYESELLEFDPFLDADYTKTGSRTGGEEHTTSNRVGSTGTVTTDYGEETHGADNSGVETTTSKDYGSTSTKTLNLQDETTVDASDVRTDNLQQVNQNEPVNEHWDYYNDTPQGGLSGIQSNTYLTNVRHVTDSGAGSQQTINDTGTQRTDTDATTTVEKTGTESNVVDTDESTSLESSTDRTYSSDKTIDSTVTDEKTTTENGSLAIDSTEDYSEHVLGKFPGSSYAKLLKEFRETLLNIDMLIIRDLADLFMTLW